MIEAERLSRFGLSAPHRSDIMMPHRSESVAPGGEVRNLPKLWST